MSKESFQEEIVAIKEKITKLKAESKHVIKLLCSSAEKEEITSEFDGFAEFTHLHSGDFWIMLDGKLLYLFERKTYADFLASFSDGRWSEQKFKMSMMPIDRDRTYYLIEDSQKLDSDKFNNKRANIVGGELNLVVRDGRRIIRTMNVNETLYFMLYYVLKTYEFAEECLEHVKDYPEIDSSFDPIKTPMVESDSKSIDHKDIDVKYVKSRGKSKIKGKSLGGPESHCLYTLNGIPRLGNKAIILSSEFPSINAMSAFLTRKDMSREDIIDELANMECPSANMGKRKTKKIPTIGKIFARKIYSYFEGKEVEDVKSVSKPKSIKKTKVVTNDGSDSD